MLTQGEKIEGATVADAVARFEQQGYGGQFGVQGACAVMCFTCRAVAEAQDVKLHAIYRLEGPSDPGSQSVVCAVVCPGCSTKGTLVMGFGPMAPPEESETFSCLWDRRRQGLLIPAEGVGQYDLPGASPKA